MTGTQPETGRRRVHLRRITCEGFVRGDGLIDIEGLLVDTKPEAIQLLTKRVAAGEPIHQMRIRLTIDRARRIVDVQASSEQHPYPACIEVEAGYRKLIGLRIEPGFTMEVKRLMRGVEGCTHMTEMIPAMASTFFQTVWSDQGFGTEAREPTEEIQIEEQMLPPTTTVDTAAPAAPIQTTAALTGLDKN